MISKCYMLFTCINSFLSQYWGQGLVCLVIWKPKFFRFVPSYKLFVSLILALNIMSNERLCVARDCCDFAGGGSGCLCSCLGECRPGSKGVVPAGPSAFCRLAEGWYSFWYQSVPDDAITKKSQKAAVSWQWPPCRVLHHCRGSISIEKMNRSRKLLAIWGCIFTSLPGCKGSALCEFSLYFTENIRFNQKKKLCYSKGEKRRIR